ncbi:hypothetical protein FKM82_025265 [Ascaphus truei]
MSNPNASVSMLVYIARCKLVLKVKEHMILFSFFMLQIIFNIGGWTVRVFGCEALMLPEGLESIPDSEQCSVELSKKLLPKERSTTTERSGTEGSQYTEQ